MKLKKLLITLTMSFSLSASTINVVYVSDQNYADPTNRSMQSILDNNPSEPIKFFVVGVGDIQHGTFPDYVEVINASEKMQHSIRL